MLRYTGATNAVLFKILIFVRRARFALAYFIHSYVIERRQSSDKQAVIFLKDREVSE